MQRGFTLIELIMILVIIGILAVFASARFTGSAPFASMSAQDQLISTARYAQQVAMTRGPTTTVSLSLAGSSYQVLVNGTAIVLPDGGTSGSFPSGVTVTPNPSTISFNSLGNTTAGAGVLTIAVTGGPNRTVTIESSGYAH